MRVIRYYILLLAILAASCSDDIPTDGGQSPAKGVISVTISVPDADGSATLANPAGGEDGNGREQGMLNENAVHDINLFFYEGSGLNPDNAGNIELRHIYIPSVNPPHVTTETGSFEKKITVTIDDAESVLGEGYGSKTISFVTVLNAGDLAGISNLNGLREYTDLSNTWQSGDTDVTGDEDYFVMSTAYDAPSGSVTVSGKTYTVGSSILEKESGEKADLNKLVGKTTVERMCARIDLMFNNELTNNKDELIYSVTGMENTGDMKLPKVHITNILPVNRMQKPSYLIRKVTAAIPETWTDETGLGTITWGGIEKPNDGSKLSSYVIEPLTLAKETVQNDGTLNEWYGETRVADVKKNIKNPDKGKVSIYYLKDQSETLNGLSYSKLLLIGYANENVQSPNQYKSDYLTGMAFHAVYQPGKVYDYSSDGEGTDKELKEVTDPTFIDGKIYRYTPSNAAGGSSTAANGGSASDVDESKAIYFSTEKAAEAYKADHAGENGVIQYFEGAKVYGEGDDRYIGFDCYYNLWLRHYNDVDDKNADGSSSDASDPHEALPMEYATVRNNIYRVAIEFTGPGDPDPVLREPNSIKARIYTRKWNFIRHAEINL